MNNVIEKFFIAFKNFDAETMTNCYHDEVVFEDPAFGRLKGERAKNMWRMLCENARDLSIEYTDIIVEDNNATAHWEAWYYFSLSGRKVHNIIDSKFELKEGKIIKHTDRFNLHRWAKQAMGFKG